jgi:hypothetical protein
MRTMALNEKSDFFYSLVRLDIVDDFREHTGVREIARMKTNLRSRSVGIDIDVIDPMSVEGTCPADDECIGRWLRGSP